MYQVQRYKPSEVIIKIRKISPENNRKIFIFYFKMHKPRCSIMALRLIPLARETSGQFAAILSAMPMKR